MCLMACYSACCAPFKQSYLQIRQLGTLLKGKVRFVFIGLHFIHSTSSAHLLSIHGVVGMAPVQLPCARQGASLATHWF